MAEGIDKLKREIRVAVFGAGKMAMHHMKAIGLQKDARLVAVADPVLAKRGHALEKESGVDLYAAPGELLEKSRPDVVHICTPPNTHADLARLALRAGANIYMEKPFVLKKKDASEIMSIAKDAGASVCAGHQLLFESPTLCADEHLRKLGRIVYIESYFSFKPVRYSSDGRTAISPLHQLIDILPHPVYLLLHFLKKNPHPAGTLVELCGLEVSASGSVHGIVRYGDVKGVLNVTLEGRPVESYVKVVGTNGFLHADYVRGATVVIPGPGASAISKVMNPYRQSWQTSVGTTRALWKRVFRKQKSYPGLFEIIEDFYGRIRAGRPDPESDASIVETVTVCEEIGGKLEAASREVESVRLEELDRKESALSPIDPAKGGVLITGGTGTLGKAVALKTREGNIRTRVVARKIPPPANRIPGVEYSAVDLADSIPPGIFKDISVVFHCAAETVGGREAHERNSIGATRNLVQAMNSAGVERLVHVSSIAVLKRIGGPITEDTPVDLDNEERGPYVWGKAQSERLAMDQCTAMGMKVKIVRPGPLVDYDNFDPPGRLGKEVGPWFVYIGSRKNRISLCSVPMAANVLRRYVDDFDSMPKILNLIEPESPTRVELVSILLQTRPDLKSFRIPFFALRSLSPFLKLLQRILRPKAKPIDIYAAFAPEKYDSTLAAGIMSNLKEG